MILTECFFLSAFYRALRRAWHLGGAVALAGLAADRAAHAEAPITETEKGGAAAISSGSATAASEPCRASAIVYPFAVGLRAFFAPGNSGKGIGLDAAYSWAPHWAIGAQHVEFVMDQGADPQYCERCIRAGSSTFVFVEGRPWPEAWARPYARLGAGRSHLHGQRFRNDSGYTENDFTLLAEVGVELHSRWASFGAYGFDMMILGTELDRDPFYGLGFQLGARF